MSESARRVLERFPESKRQIHELIESNASFNTLCHDYNHVVDEIDRLVRQTDPRDIVRGEELQRRRVAMETELLALMEGNIRV